MENIKEILSKRQLYTVTKGTTIKEIVFYMAEKGVGLVPIMESGKLVGVFS